MADQQQRPAARRFPGWRAALLGSVAILGVGVAGLELPAWADNANAAPANADIKAPVDNGYADLAAAVMPAVVNVQVERTTQAAENSGPDSPFNDPEMRKFFERFFGQVPERGQPQQQPQQRRMVGEGSGFIISSDGLIVTNYHVAGEADKINVTLKDGTVYKATLKGADKKTDLALIKIDAKKPLPYVAFGDSGKVRPGDKVLAVGNPFGLGGTVTAGIVSAVGREIGEGPYDDFIQVDAPINRGNSGGPTFDMRGNVIGVNTAIFSPSGGSVGIGFAIASNQAKQIVNQLMEHGTVDRGFLGVSIQPIDPDLAKALKLDDTHGALVSKVEPDSPAAKAGVKSRDVILQFDGKEVEKPSQLSRYVAGTQAGKSSELVLWRDGKRETLQVDVGKMPSKETASNEQGGDQADKNQPKLGLSLAPLTPDTRDQLNLDQKVEGVVVTQVQPDSPADQKGIQPGDIIMSVNQKAVKDPRQVQDAVKKAHEAGDQTVLMLLMRDGQQIFEAVPLAAS
jgi:serine protease Do